MSHVRHQMRRWLVIRIFAVLGVLGAMIALNTFSIQPRFDYAPLNYVAAMVLALALPISLSWLAFAALTRTARWLVFGLAMVFSVPVLLFVVLAFTELKSIVAEGNDPSFKRLAELNDRNYSYSVYRTNGGATTSFGIVLRRELRIVSGVRLVQVLETYDRARDATLEKLPSGAVRLVVKAYGSGPGQREFVYQP